MGRVLESVPSFTNEASTTIPDADIAPSARSAVRIKDGLMAILFNRSPHSASRLLRSALPAEALPGTGPGEWERRRTRIFGRA